MTSDEKRRVLMTGAAGRIGKSFYEVSQDRYAFTLAGRSASLQDMDLPTGHSSLVLDVSNYDQVRSACEGIDTVLHLAADPSPMADFDDSLVENNFRGTYNIFRAAEDAGCRRVIFASSVHAMLGYPQDQWPVPESNVTWPINMYGVSKVFGEATAKKFASTSDLSCIAIRIGAFQDPMHLKMLNRHIVSCYVSQRDLHQLIGLCIDDETIKFAIVHGQSDNRISQLSIQETKALLGYAPQDDGYQTYGEPTADEWWPKPDRLERRNP